MRAGGRALVKLTGFDRGNASVGSHRPRNYLSMRVAGTTQNTGVARGEVERNDEPFDRVRRRVPDTGFEHLDELGGHACCVSDLGTRPSPGGAKPDKDFSERHDT